MAILYFCFYRRSKGKAVCLALAAVLCVAADQAVKWLVVNTMTLGQSQPLLPPLLRLTRVHNYGAAWSSFSGARWLLIILTAVGMGVLAWLLVKVVRHPLGQWSLAWLLVKVVRHPLGQWSLACILGGGIGNLIDRVRLGYVVDMLDTMFMDFPVFNVADVFVVCGTICALIYYLAFYGKYDEKHRENKTDGTDPAANK
ncbi:MAG TPA: signal peptidase II [Oscillibacter sp.]|nr:signal peptidase II [Oscillibacter sp.]